MKIVRPLTKEDMKELGRAIAKSDIEFSKKISQMASSLGLELPQDKIIKPAMPYEVRKGYDQIMNKEPSSNGENYLPGKKDYTKKR